MSGIATAIAGTAIVGGIMSKKAGESAGTASRDAAAISAQGEREALEYMQEKEALPIEIRDRFLPQLADIYSGGAGQEQLIRSAEQSPLYQQLVGNQAFGEEAILRNAAATGGLRSGNTQRALSEYNTRLRNEALTQAYGQQLEGIQGLAGIPLNTQAIARGIAAPGQTTAQGMVGGAQAEQLGTQNMINSLSQGVGTLAMYKAFSDIRLKTNIKPEGTRNGHRWYSWTWNEDAEKLDLKGQSEGVMAHEVKKYYPEAIDTQDGYLIVDMKLLGVQ